MTETRAQAPGFIRGVERAGCRPRHAILSSVAHRYRLYPAPRHIDTLSMHCAHTRQVWNMALEQANLYRPHWGPTPNSAERSRQLAEARKDSWLGDGSSSVQQQALRDFDQALKNWWGGSHRRPTWRSFHKGHRSFKVRDVTVTKLNRKWATIGVPKLGPIKFRLSRPLPAEYGMATISQDRAGRWHVSFTAPQPTFHREQTGAEVGVDMGVTHGISTSDGWHASPAGLTAGEKRRKLALQRRLARQCKGSNRRAVTKAKLARLSARERDRRKDWIEQTSTRLVRDYDLIALEALKVRNMMRSAKGTVEKPGKNVARKAALNRGIASVGWAELRTRIEQKATAATSPVVVVAVDPRNTSRRCAACGHTEEANRESQAFACRACGHHAHADVNAGVNILAAGRAVIGRGEGSCVPGEASSPVAAYRRI